MEGKAWIAELRPLRALRIAGFCSGARCKHRHLHTDRQSARDTDSCSLRPGLQPKLRSIADPGKRSHRSSTNRDSVFIANRGTGSGSMVLAGSPCISGLLVTKAIAGRALVGKSISIGLVLMANIGILRHPARRSRGTLLCHAGPASHGRIT